MLQSKLVVAYWVRLEVIIISKLATIRKSKGLTQRKLAVMSGVHRVLIAKYETGVISPNIRNLKKLSDALEVPVDELIDRKGA